MANEMTSASSWATPAHDKAGNMTTLPSPLSPATALHLTYDAWNRLVEVRAADDSTVIAQYQYDGTNRRSVKKTYSGGSLAETRHFYYNAQGQLLEERASTQNPAPSPETLAPVCQNVWSPRYIDALILRDRDSDGSSATGDLGQTGSGLDERLYCLQDANFNAAALPRHFRQCRRAFHLHRLRHAHLPRLLLHSPHPQRLLLRLGYVVYKSSIRRRNGVISLSESVSWSQHRKIYKMGSDIV